MSSLGPPGFPARCRRRPAGGSWWLVTVLAVYAALVLGGFAGKEFGGQGDQGGQDSGAGSQDQGGQDSGAGSQDQGGQDSGAGSQDQGGQDQ